MRFFRSKLVLLSLGVVVVVAAAGGGALYHFHIGTAAVANAQFKTPEEADMYVRFDLEVYDKIINNYWDKATDAQMASLFQSSIQKALNAPSAPTLATDDRAGAAKMLKVAMDEATSTDAKKQLATNIAIVALYNLQPAARSGLLSDQQETALRQEVSNVHPDNDLYGNLGVSKDASADQINTAYAQKQEELKNATSSEAKQELAQAQYAHQVLTNTSNKKLYDQAKIEPTVFGRVLGKTLYFNMTQISPTTIQEFGLAVDQASTTPNLDSLIIDLRSNIGGALDFTQAFLGLFIGQNQYAFDLFHQGDYQVQRTTIGKFPELDRFKDIAILTDNMTQSTAELSVATFKKFRLAHVVGANTRGWGTVENTYPIETVIDSNTKYSLLLVNSITLRDDNQPIEGRGVAPDVDTSQKGWQSELSNYFHSASVITALKQYATQPPLK